MPIISGNSTISNVHYSGYTISKIYACGGSLVWSGTPTPTGTYRVKVTKIDGTEAYSYCDGAYSGYKEVSSQEVIRTIGGGSSVSSFDEIRELSYGSCPILSGLTFNNGGIRNSTISSITFDNTSITHIGNLAFQVLTGLETITIPDSITSMDSSVFSGSGLRSVHIGSGLTEIPHGTFLGTPLRTVTIPSGITSIGNSAFGRCTSLSQITFAGDAVTTIGAQAFTDCDTLRTFDVPTGVTKLEDGTFEACNNLRTIELNNVNTFGKEIFKNCSSLHTVNLSGVTTMDRDNFRGCTSLSSVTLSDNLIRLPLGTFYDCSSLSSMTLPNSVKYIDESAFHGCSSLSNINLSNVEEFGRSVFYGCNSLTSVTLDNVVTIGIESFYPSMLTDITIGEDIISIGRYAFGSNNLPSSSITITILATLPPAIDSAGIIQYPNKIKEIYVPDAVVEDYKNDWSLYADRIKPISEKP